MVTGVNSSGVTVGSDGKISVSGFSSNIDSKAIIESIMAAKRIPAVRIENSIKANTTLISAYGDLKTQAKGMTDALDLLRGNVGFQAANVFNTKTATGTTRPSDTAPGGHVPSGINDLLVASVGNNAVNGNYQITVQQTAKAQQIRGDVTASKSTALGMSGTFEINGKNITVAASDTLLDVRAKINASGAGVTAAIVSSSDTSHYLVLTSNKTGVANEINFNGGNALTDGLGLTAAGVVKTELQEAKDAILDINGITGITRSSNDIDDVIEGVTLRLQKAEANTVIDLQVSPDLNAIKVAINDFVEAYNGLRDFVTDQRELRDRNDDGVVGADEFGPLAFDGMLRQIVDQLAGLAGASIAGNDDGFKSLGQLGITLGADYKLQMDQTVLDNRLLTNVDQVRKAFAFEVSSSDARVTTLARTADTVAGTYYLNVAGTDGSGNLTGANIRTTAGAGAGGAGDASLTVNGNIMVGNSGTGAEGLRMIFNGGNNAAGVDDIRIDVSRGIADQFYDFFNGLTANTTGQLDTISSTLQLENSTYQSRVEVIDSRLEVTRSQLVIKYTNMETALARLENLKSTIESYFEQMNSGQ